MHILYVYQFYNSPDCCTTAKHYWFIRHFVEQGHTVSLVSSRHFLDQRLTDEFEWLPEGVRAVHLDVPYGNAMGVPRRALAFAEYTARALAAGLRMPRPDVVFGVSTPLTTAWVARQIARVKRVPWLFEVKDLWPLVPIEMGAIPHPLAQKALYRMERNLYRSAAHVISLSPGMTDYMTGQQGVPPEKITTLINGTDFPLLDRVTEADVARLRAEHGLAGKKVILYGGKYGRNNDIPTLLRAAERLRHRDDFRFVFIGYGFLEPEVKAAAERLPNFLALPALPKHAMFPWFRLADLSLFSVVGVPSLGTASPSKVFDSLGAGTPIVMISPGWATELVVRERVGFATPTGDDAALAAVIEEAFADEGALVAMGERGRALAERDFDRRDHVRLLEAVFEAVVAGAPVAPRVADVDAQIAAEKQAPERITR